MKNRVSNKGWWKLFISIPCLVNLIQYGPNGGNLIGLCIGAAVFGGVDIK